MCRRARIVAVILLSILGAPTGASADTNAEVQQQVRELKLSPLMLYPTRLPSRLANADVTLSTEGELSVAWDRGSAPRGHNQVGAIGLTRGPRSQLRDDLRTSRRRGYRPRRVALGRRHPWRLCGHVCGYAWVENSRYYGVYGIYYIGDEDGQTVDRDQRYLIRHLRPLG
jgi:hypothetical protein